MDENVENANLGLLSAKTSKAKEIEILQSTNKDLQNTIETLQKQYNESLVKILELSSTIRTQQSKIDDFEYLASRSLRSTQ